MIVTSRLFSREGILKFNKEARLNYLKFLSKNLEAVACIQCIIYKSQHLRWKYFRGLVQKFDINLKVAILYHFI